MADAKQEQATQPEEPEEELSAYERQRNANVQLNRGVLEGLGLGGSALRLGRKSKAPAKKRARLEAPERRTARASKKITRPGEEDPRSGSVRLAGRDARRYSEDLIGSEDEEDT